MMTVNIYMPLCLTYMISHTLEVFVKALRTRLGNTPTLPCRLSHAPESGPADADEVGQG